jgi:hypothetical protein
MSAVSGTAQEPVAIASIVVPSQTPLVITKLRFFYLIKIL